MIKEMHLKFFEGRKIKEEVVADAGVYSQGDAIVFPSFENGLTVNEKFRGPHKKFWQSPDGKQCFYNLSGLDLAVMEEKPLVITEGELDCLSVLQSRYAWVVSVPCGAPSQEIEFYSLEEDNKFSFLWNDKSTLDKLKTIILAGDDDEPGRVLNHELSKRLGVERCRFITYPEGCKDLNEVLIKFDESKIHELINTAKNYPVVGLYKPGEFPIMPERYKHPYKTGMGYHHDRMLKIMLGKFMVITGIPGHGKSEWADGLVLNLAQLHDWKICVCSPEIDDVEYQENTIHRILRRPLTLEDGEYKYIGPNEYDKAFEFYREHYTFITNQTLKDDLELTLEKFIEIAEIAILRDGCKVLVIDPFNEIEHCREKGESETDYVGRAIRKLKKFARQYGVLVIVVTHPTKPPHGKMEIPSLYSISGSAHWANKSDYGVVVWREDTTQSASTIRLAKIKRHGSMGYPGDIAVALDKTTSRFEET